jgi:AcrR family transcriptional regulator
MPFARFEKLAKEKKERILDVAAQEFATNGYQNASLNHILEKSQMSKGGAYYYFEDKADLFVAVIQYCSTRLGIANSALNIEQLTAETFWPTLIDWHRHPLVHALDQPWLFTVLRVASNLPPTTLQQEPLATLAANLQDRIMKAIKRGQQLGMIRTDIAVELLFQWIQALDTASDQWLIAHWEELDTARIIAISDLTVDAMKRALQPAPMSSQNAADASLPLMR